MSAIRITIKFFGRGFVFSRVLFSHQELNLWYFTNSTEQENRGAFTAFIAAPTAMQSSLIFAVE